MSGPDRIWHAIDRKGKISGCPDAHVMPCADVQDAYTEYVRADLCEPTQDERVMTLIDLLRIDPWAIGWREWMLRRSTALRALERGEDR